jgi:hypothetical protein
VLKVQGGSRENKRNPRDKRTGKKHLRIFDLLWGRLSRFEAVEGKVLRVKMIGGNDGNVQYQQFFRGVNNGAT